MEDFLTPAYLATIVAEADKLKMAETPATNMFFSQKTYTDNGFVKVPKEVFNVDDLLPLVEPNSAIPATPIDMSREYTTYELKSFGDLKMYKPSEVAKFVEQVAHVTGDTKKAKRAEIANEIINTLNNKVNATREYMACSALLGSIKDNKGNVIETFNIPSANKLGAKKVSDDTVKVYKLLREMQTAMRTATKYKGSVALVLGQSAHEKLMDSPSFQRWMESPANNLSAEESLTGVEGFIGGKKFPFIILDDFYYDKGVAKNFFNPDTMLMAPTKIFAEFYGSIETNKGSFPQQKLIDTNEMWNPDGTAYRLQTRSMPIVTLPNGIITATLS